MKPTEQDIQAELDQYGLDGWSITKQYDHHENFYFWIEKSDGTGVYLFNINKSIDFGIEDNDLYLSVNYTDFLTGNYDLSAISQHYDPEEWQRIITMCERIVRLITGEQTLEEKQESLPFNEWVHIILQSHEVEQSDDEYEKTCITEDGFARIYASELVIVIQPEEEVMHISTLDPPKSFTHDLCEWDEMSVLEFPAPDLDYILWTDHLKRALFEIIETLEADALLTPSDQPEQTLEEAVRGILEPLKRYTKITISHIHDDEVSFCSTSHQYWITSDKVIYSRADGNVEKTIAEYVQSGLYVAEFKEIAALLSTRSTKPSYSDLVQRVEELEEGKALLIKDCEIWKRKHDELDVAYSHVDEMLEESLICIDARDSQVENLKSANRQWADRLREETKRITDLEAQLQDYISPADHEAEKEKWRTAFDTANEKYKRQCDDARFYMEAFHREYAKNAEASQ